MLTAYLVCLVVGGVFVGLSVFAGLGKDTDGVDNDLDKDFDKSFDKDFDKSFEKELELDHDHDVVSVHEAPMSDAALAGHPGEKRDVPRRYGPKAAPWLPFASMRFWTFGSCFFGLTGVALTQLAGVGEPTAALASLGLGMSAGMATAWLMRRLRQPVGAVGSAAGWVGVVGELAHPLGQGQVSKVKVRLPGRPPRELLAVLAAHSGPLPSGCKVVVLDFREGQAVVQAADPSMLTAEQPMVAAHEVPSEEEA